MLTVLRRTCATIDLNNFWLFSSSSDYLRNVVPPGSIEIFSNNSCAIHRMPIPTCSTKPRRYVELRCDFRLFCKKMTTFWLLKCSIISPTRVSREYVTKSYSVLYRLHQYSLTHGYRITGTATMNGHEHKNRIKASLWSSAPTISSRLSLKVEPFPYLSTVQCAQAVIYTYPRPNDSRKDCQ